MTAASVPACTEISNTRPKSFAPKISEGNNKWAELETGKNSVSPWIKANNKAKKKSEIISFDTQVFLSKQD